MVFFHGEAVDTQTDETEYEKKVSRRGTEAQKTQGREGESSFSEPLRLRVR